MSLVKQALEAPFWLDGNVSHSIVKEEENNLPALTAVSRSAPTEPIGGAAVS
jgi:hypothetical protein